MDFGLRQQDLVEIVQVLKQHTAVHEALIFGSRAKGDYKKGSDIDIAVKGRGIDRTVVASLSFQLNDESASPYFFDVVHFEEISEEALIEHINRVGQTIYLRDKMP